MKRSEMVVIIEKFINKELMLKEYTEIWLNSNKYADELLMLLEDNGMKPPEIEIGGKSYHGIYSNEWEPENE